MVLVPVLSLVVSVFPLLYRPDPLLQLDQASHVRGEVVLLAAWWGRRVAAVLLALVGHHLLDAYHGLSFTDQRHLVDNMVMEEEEEKNKKTDSKSRH